jgi:PAS domain S-box-containing protein
MWWRVGVDWVVSTSVYMHELVAGNTALAGDSEALARLAVDALPVGVVLLGPDGRISLVNQALARQFGYSSEELAGQPLAILVPEDSQVQASVRAASTGKPARAIHAGRDLVGRHRDGSRVPIEIGLSPFATAAGTCVIAAVVDVSSRRQAEASHRASIESLLAFERLVAQLFLQFINLPFDQVDGAIQVALRRIGETLALDRCAFHEIQADGSIASPLLWAAPGVPPPPIPMPAAPSKLFPWAFGRLRAGDAVCFSHLDEIPNPEDRGTFRRFGTQSAVIVPLWVAGRLVGAVGFSMVRRERSWLPDEVHRLRVFAGTFASVLARRQGDEALHARLTEVQRLRDRLQAENLSLRREVEERLSTGTIVGHSAAVRRVLEQVEQVAATDSTVLLLGETGTGKELFARRIHELSRRRDRAMVSVNCAAMPATLIESELFGREKGAYTGALARQIGRFEMADHSTIFLDEIGDLPAEVQVKLLRVLEERQIERLGSPNSIHVDTRIVAATHRNLERLIADNAFREDLFYRLNVFPIQVPPLRERTEDVPLLVWRFVDEFSRSFGKRIEAISRDNMTALQAYAWPGNIRELRNAVERAMILAHGPRLTIPPPAPSRAAEKLRGTLVEVETAHIRAVLEATSWRIRGAGGAADRLGLRPTTLETRMAKLGLNRPRTA